MDLVRFQQLLDGDAPSLEEYAVFSAVISQLDVSELWQLLTQNPKMHWMLSGQINKQLQEKIPREKTERAVQRILERLRTKIK